MGTIKSNPYKLKALYLLVLCAIVSCARAEKISQTELQQAVSERKELHEQSRDRAIVNFHNLSFRKKLEADVRKPADWWTPLEIGEEVIVLSQIVKDSTGVEYLEIQRTNPKQDTGYARAAFIAIGARLVVVSGQDAFRYSSQSLTRLTKDTVPFMSLIAVRPDTSYEGLIQFDYNNEGGVVYKEQYIEESQISYLDSDIDTAKFVFLARITKDPVLQLRFLQKAKDFGSTAFAAVVSDYTAILKNDFTPLLKEGLLKELTPPTLIVTGSHTVFFRSTGGSEGVILGSFPPNQEIMLTYETLARTSLEGKAAPWYLVPGSGWIFGADIEGATHVEPSSKASKDKNKNKEKTQKNKDEL